MIVVKQPQFTWIHLHNAKPGDIQRLQEEYDFHELIEEDLIELSGENKVEYYEDDQVVSMLMNFPKYDTKLQKYHHHPFVIIVSEKYVLSLSKYTSKHLDNLIQRAQKPDYLAQDMATPTFDLVYDIIDTMYDKSVKGLVKAGQDVVKIQDSIEAHRGLSKEILDEIMARKINMVTLQHIFRPQRQILHEFKSSIKKILRTDEEEVEDAKLYVEDLDSKLDKILDGISLNYESLKALADTYRAVIDLQTNRNISRLTMITIGLGILEAIGAIYGMNVILPGEQHPYMFFYLIGGALLSILIGYSVLKWMRMM